MEWAELMAQVAREADERETMEREWHREACPVHGRDAEWHRDCPCDGRCSCDLGLLEGYRRPVAALSPYAERAYGRPEFCPQHSRDRGALRSHSSECLCVDNL